MSSVTDLPTPPGSATLRIAAMPSSAVTPPKSVTNSTSDTVLRVLDTERRGGGRLGGRLGASDAGAES